MPIIMTQATGMKLASGVFVEIYGMHCKIPFTMKKPLMTLFSCWKRENGRKVKAEYFVELTLFVR